MQKNLVIKIKRYLKYSSNKDQIWDYDDIKNDPVELIKAINSILEHEGEDPFDGWLHISSKRCLSENRKEVLRAVRQDGKTMYLPGIN